MHHATLNLVQVEEDLQWSWITLLKRELTLRIWLVNDAVLLQRHYQVILSIEIKL